MNCNGQRVVKYAFMQLNESAHLNIVAEYDILDKNVKFIKNVTWPNGEPPLDTPKCGYDMSKCPCKS